MKLYKKIDNKIQCLLCPHFCILKACQVGICRVRRSNSEEIELINYGLVSAMAVESIEKKPFKHYLEGSKTLSIALKSKCNLDCKFCENHEISQSNNIEGEYVSISDIIKLAKNKKCLSVSMSYNEPTLSYEFLIDLAKKCNQEDLKFILKTNAFINKELWNEICQVTEAVNIDWKGSEDNFKSITGVNSYVLQDRIKEAYEAGVHIEISIPLYYKDSELEGEIETAGRFLSSIDSNITCHLLRISPAYKYNNFIFNSENLEKSKKILSEYMNNIYFVV